MQELEPHRVTILARLKATDSNVNARLNGGPEQSVRLWWTYLFAGCVGGMGTIVAVSFGWISAVAIIGPSMLMMFQAGFYYSERLRLQGKTRGLFGVRPPVL